MTEERRIEAKRTVTLHILKMVAEYKTVLSFFPLGKEINLSTVNKELLAQNKLLLTKIEKDHLVPYQVQDLQHDLIRNDLGVLEPDTDKCTKVQETIDCVLVPGLAFDREGNRLGRGMGYYDRLLSAQQCTHSIGLGFQEQVVSGILPIEPHDKPVEKLCVG